MFTKAEATAERISAYQEALENEKQQLELAHAQENAAGNSARVDRLEQRLKANAAELARVKKLKPTADPDDDDKVAVQIDDVEDEQPAEPAKGRAKR